MVHNDQTITSFTNGDATQKKNIDVQLGKVRISGEILLG